MPSCAHCHVLTGPNPEFNPYGNLVFGELVGAGHDPDAAVADDTYISLINAAILASESVLLDADDDGVSTTEEIALGTNPGDILDVFESPAPPLGDPNPNFNVGNYDINIAYQRVGVAFCGQSLSYDEKTAFATMTAEEQSAELHTKLDLCMRTPYWRDEALPKLADNKIKPIPRFEQWRWDFRLWRYANLPPCDEDDGSCGDALPRSARDLLTGTYHVRELGPSELVQDDGASSSPGACTVETQVADCGIDSFCQGTSCAFLGGNQPLQDQTKRAGMITTTWFHFFNTMFSAMPRTTAAQAMRAYLGTDIAKQEGLIHNPNEPADVDDKGVDQDTCYECHMVLDGATYAFAYYRGIEPGGGAGTFSETRPIDRNLWATEGEARTPTFFTTEVPDLVAWANEAADSDFFKRTHTLTFFKHAVGREPCPDEAEEFEALWRSMSDDNYETPALLHRLVDTNAFGGI